MRMQRSACAAAQSATLARAPLPLRAFSHHKNARGFQKVFCTNCGRVSSSKPALGSILQHRLFFTDVSELMAVISSATNRCAALLCALGLAILMTLPLCSGEFQIYAHYIYCARKHLIMPLLIMRLSPQINRVLVCIWTCCGARSRL
jgi:hypothetical protein